MNKLFQLLKTKARYILVCLGLFAFIMGYVGFGRYFNSQGIEKTIWDKIYLTIQLFVLESGAVTGSVNNMLEIARFIAPVTAAYAAIVALIVIFRNQLHYFLAKFKSNHIVICGLGDKGLRFFKHYKQQGKKIIVIELDEDNDYIETCRNLGGIVILGNATDLNVLKNAKIKKANKIFSVCGTDSQNINVAIQIRDSLNKTDEPSPDIYINILEPLLCRQLMYKEILSGHAQKGKVEFFNIFDLTSEYWVDTFTHELINQSKKEAHIAIFGMETMGENLILHIAQKWFNIIEKRIEKLKISIIDEDIGKKAKSLKNRYQFLSNLEEKNSKENYEFKINGINIKHNQINHNLINKYEFDDIYLTYEQGKKSISTALAISNLFSNTKNSIHLVTKVDNISHLGDLFFDSNNKSLNNSINFISQEQILQPEKIVKKGLWERIGKAIHQEYINYMRNNFEKENLNKNIVDWDELNETYKKYNINQAAHTKKKMAKFNYKIVPLINWNEKKIQFNDSDEIEIMAKMEHYRWNKEKIDHGWEFGDKRNDDKKIHTCLLKWDKDDSIEEISELMEWSTTKTEKIFSELPANRQLPENEKEKDKNFCRKIPAYLHQVGYQIVK